ncbi:MAG: hypothetical protein HRK26_03620 [Rickettsiaceae bacterium H1]|nr:hypothetical protein [Rickettsiaceae bacterium H1]
MSNTDNTNVVENSVAFGGTGNTNNRSITISIDSNASEAEVADAMITSFGRDNVTIRKVENNGSTGIVKRSVSDTIEDSSLKGLGINPVADKEEHYKPDYAAVDEVMISFDNLRDKPLFVGKLIDNIIEKHSGYVDLVSKKVSDPELSQLKHFFEMVKSYHGGLAEKLDRCYQGDDCYGDLLFASRVYDYEDFCYSDIIF